jgi:hypothetical protein
VNKSVPSDPEANKIFLSFISPLCAAGDLPDLLLTKATPTPDIECEQQHPVQNIYTNKHSMCYHQLTAFFKELSEFTLEPWEKLTPYQQLCVHRTSAPKKTKKGGKTTPAKGSSKKPRKTIPRFSRTNSGNIVAPSQTNHPVQSGIPTSQALQYRSEPKVFATAGTELANDINFVIKTGYPITDQLCLQLVSLMQANLTSTSRENKQKSGGTHSIVTHAFGATMNQYPAHGTATINRGSKRARVLFLSHYNLAFLALFHFALPINQQLVNLSQAAFESLFATTGLTTGNNNNFLDLFSSVNTHGPHIIWPTLPPRFLT